MHEFGYKVLDIVLYMVHLATKKEALHNSGSHSMGPFSNCCIEFLGDQANQNGILVDPVRPL